MVTSTNVLAHFSDSNLALMTEFNLEGLPDNVLEHHGVKGMKWGVRKDRKGSGSGSNRKSSDKKSIIKGVSGESVKKAVSTASSTAASKVKTLIKERKEKRQAAKAEAEKQKEKQKPLNDALEKHEKKSSNTINKKYKDLTNDDLRALNERMRLEKEYDELVSARGKQNQTTSQKMANWAKETTVSIASDLAKQQMRKYGEKILSDAVGSAVKTSNPTKGVSNSIDEDKVKQKIAEVGKKTISDASSHVVRSQGKHAMGNNKVSAKDLIAKYSNPSSDDRRRKGRHRK